MTHRLASACLVVAAVLGAATVVVGLLVATRGETGAPDPATALVLLVLSLSALSLGLLLRRRDRAGG